MPLMMNRCIGSVVYLGGIPAVLEEFCWSWGQMIQCNTELLCGPGEMIHYDRTRFSVHDVARNVLAESMRGDWIVMLDTDHQFDPDICARLLNAADTCNVDVVSGLYRFRTPPHHPVLYLMIDGEMRSLGDYDHKMKYMQVDSAGAGCLFVRRRVFDRIKAELKEGPFNRIGVMGEDHSFFLRLKKLGIKAVAAMDVECHHLQVKPLSGKDFDPEIVDLERHEDVRYYQPAGGD